MAPTVRTFPEDSIEAKAYAAVADIPTEEVNDRNRLGYHVFLYLTKELPTLADAVHVAQARMPLTKEEAVARIAAKLRASGLAVEG